MGKLNNKKYTIILSCAISFCCLIAVYIGISIYFIDRFYFGSAVNNVNIAGKTVEEAEEEVKNEVKNYTLSIEGRDSFKDEIRWDSINLQYTPNDKIQQLKDNESGFGWLVGLFTEKNHRITGVVSFDENLLKKQFDNLLCIKSNDIVDPKNPTFKYEDGKYSVIKEVQGNRVDKDVLYEKVKDAILAGKKKIDLDKEECYLTPKYTIDSPEVENTKKELEKYTKADISYTFADNTEVIDGNLISNWLDVDDDLNVTLNENKINDYVSSLAAKYNTVGKQRDFVTSLGTAIKVGGGSYGWIIDKKAQAKDIIDEVKSGDKETKEPVYSQKAFCKGVQDIGKTYVEVDLGGQQLWYYKDGALIAQGSIVSGNVSNGHATPSGVYKLNYKERNATLRGQGYSTPVSYWMPFNGGIGIHDATWRGSFGGRIYVTNGSHGCVNAPYGLAQTIFSNIEEGTPIVCYY